MTGITGLSVEDVSALARLGHPDVVMERLRGMPSGKFRHATPEAMARLARLVGKRRWAEFTSPIRAAFAAVAPLPALRDTFEAIRQQALASLASARAHRQELLETLHAAREAVRQALAPLLPSIVKHLAELDPGKANPETPDQPERAADPPARLLVTTLTSAANAPSPVLEPAA